jgi:hypothetical protein
VPADPVLRPHHLRPACDGRYRVLDRPDWLLGLGGRRPDDTALAPYAPPANDSFASATVVTTLEPVLTGDNCASTAEPGEPLDEYASRRTVWYAWTPTITVTESLPDLPQHLEGYSKPHVIEKKYNPRVASYASR